MQSPSPLGPGVANTGVAGGGGDQQEQTHDDGVPAVSHLLTVINSSFPGQVWNCRAPGSRHPTRLPSSIYIYIMASDHWVPVALIPMTPHMLTNGLPRASDKLEAKIKGALSIPMAIALL